MATKRRKKKEIKFAPLALHGPSVLLTSTLLLMQIWPQVNIVKTLTTQKNLNKMDAKKLREIASQLRKASAMHKGQALKIDKMLKNLKSKKK